MGFGYTIINITNQIFNIYSWVLVIYALMSWLPGARESALGQFISRLAQPYIDIFDRIIPPVGGISFNVIIALFTLQLAQRGVITLLLGIFG